MTGRLLAAAFAATSIAFLGAALTPGAGARPLSGRSEGDGNQVGEVPTIGLPPRAMLAIATAVGVLVGWVVAGPIGLAGGAALGFSVPVAIDRRRARRAAHRLEEQLLDVVTSMAASLRTGRSMVQSLAAAGDEVGPPIGPVLDEAAGRVALGVHVDEVLEELAARVGGEDSRLVIGVLLLHRRTGGALASSLDDLAATLRARRDGARELRSLTAQARLSATILGLLPFGFFLFLSVVARRDVESAYRTAAGASAIGLGLALQGVAFLWIRRLLRVEDR
ncbi:MAG: type II secretion system F family protein [Actinomycetota bacterium]